MSRGTKQTRNKDTMCPIVLSALKKIKGKEDWAGGGVAGIARYAR